ncbi:PA3496 family putative envelope integrity protein [Pseudomonadota bacterium]
MSDIKIEIDDDFESEDFLVEDTAPPRSNNRNRDTRRRIENLIEERRLRSVLEDPHYCWND